MVEDLREAVEEVQAEVEEVQERVEDPQERVGDVQEAVEDLQERVEDLQEEVADLLDLVAGIPFGGMGLEELAAVARPPEKRAARTTASAHTARECARLLGWIRASIASGRTSSASTPRRDRRPCLVKTATPSRPAERWANSSRRG